MTMHFIYAHELHRIQTRKGTTIPYISHLMAVSALVVEHGGDEDQAIAALLHDAAEDQGGQETLDEIRRRFGIGVAEIVNDCTDPLKASPHGGRGSMTRWRNRMGEGPDCGALAGEPGRGGQERGAEAGRIRARWSSTPPCSRRT